MTHSDHNRPPRLALSFFRWFCQPELRESIEGDLLERFHNRATASGIREARWLFIKDVLLLFRPGIIRNFKRTTHHKIVAMKKYSWRLLVLINVLWIALIMLPFLPGPPNTLVIVLSILGQLAGFLGVLLVPIGIAWLIFTTRRSKKTGRRPSPIPFYFITIPFVAFFTWYYLVDPVSDYSRQFAIKRSLSLIASIEEYKNKEGQYPASLQALEARYPNRVPSPFIMGISAFRYNKINDHYSLSFSQWLEVGSLEEIVLYDKGNLHANIESYSRYDYSLDLHRVNGAFAIYETGYDHWISYHCD